MNEGSYSPDDFGYESPHALGFHPLGRSGRSLVERAELFTLIPPGSPIPSTSWLTEGPDADHAETAGGTDLFGPGLALHGAASGNLDQDAHLELVAVELVAGGDRLVVHRADRLEDGSYVTEVLHDIPGEGWAFRDASVVLGDVDGDFVDELVVVARDATFGEQSAHAWLRVYDDPDAGGSRLLHHARDHAHDSLEALVGDFDGDHRAEVGFGLENTDGRYSVRVFDLPRQAGGMESGMEMVLDWVYLTPAGTSSRAIAVDLDGDGDDELAAVLHTSPPFLSDSAYALRAFDWTSEGQLELLASEQMSLAATSFSRSAWDLTSARRGDRQRADVAVGIPVGNSLHADFFAYDRASGELQHERASLGVQAGALALRLASGDADADGYDELSFGDMRRLGSSSTVVYQSGDLDHDELAATLRPGRTFQTGPFAPPAPVLVVADVDADGLQVEYTGLRTTRMASPIPLVLMHAPPTKDGISQNYDGSETEYTIGTSSEQSVGVTTQVTASASAGVEGGGSFFGVGVEASATATIGLSLAKSEVSTTRTSFVQGFSGSYDADVLIFQGTLYESYDYRIVDAPEPDRIGMHFTIDLPVAAQTYKWTVDYYNSVVDLDSRIPDGLRSHRVGEPESYPTRAQLGQELAPYVHWTAAQESSVGQGSGVNFSTIALAEEQATEEQSSVFAEFEVGFKVGNVTGGASVGIERTEAYSVAYGTETTFTGAVGDIAAAGDYETWRYNWGVAVHNVGMLAGGGNEPTGFEPGETPFQIIRFWVEPVGPGY